MFAEQLQRLSNTHTDTYTRATADTNIKLFFYEIKRRSKSHRTRIDTWRGLIGALEKNLPLRRLCLTGKLAASKLRIEKVFL